MSNYYKYNFISPDNLYTLIKEEFRSYFDAQVVDDLLFPIWTERCLKKLGRATHKIKEDVLNLDDFQSRLPQDFYAVREAWLCTDVGSLEYKTQGATYMQVTEEMYKIWESCGDYSVTCSTCDTCLFPDTVRAIYKKQDTFSFTFRKSYLLKPGNISAINQCDYGCANIGSTAPETFDIRDNKFITNFRNGSVYLIYYALETDEQGTQLIPDNIRIQEYIEKYIKYKLFEMLSNGVTDETFNQIQSKLSFYKQEADEALVIAQIELKKETIYQKMDAIEQSYNRNNKYQIRNRYGRRPKPR